MTKLNTEDLFMQKKDESDKLSTLIDEKVDSYNRQMKAKLLKLREDFEKDQSEYYERLHKPGRKPKRIYDINEITEKYEAEKRKIENEWERNSRKLEKQYDSLLKSQNTLQNNNFTLTDVIKEYAIYSKACRGDIIYPTTACERGILLSMLDIDEAIKEFISSTQLSKSEVEYLKK